MVLLLAYVLAATYTALLGRGLWVFHSRNEALAALRMRYLLEQDAVDSSLYGKIGGFQVRLYKASGTSFLDAPSNIGVSGLPEGISLRRESALDKLRREEVQLGHEGFDKAFFLSGPEAHLRALLDANTRKLLMNQREDVEIRANGELRVRCAHPHDLDAQVRFAIDLAEAFSAGGEELRDRLAHIARSEPMSEVRLQALEALRDVHEPAVSEVAQDLLRDRDPDVALEAAMILDRGDAVAFSIGRGLVHPEREVRALRWLADRDDPHLGDTVRRAARKGSPGVQALAVELIGAQADHYPLTKVPTEDFLLGLLAEATPDGLLPPVLRCLGEVGSRAAIEPLITMREQLSEASEAGARSLIDSARAQILERIGPANAGGLSLADADHAGALTEVSTRGGELSEAVRTRASQKV